MIEACICTIGDEILIGQIVDTNSAFISKKLNDSGIKVTAKVSVGDDYNQILETLKELSRKFQVVITTGGLGPTKDDITKKVFADFSESEKFVLSESQLHIIEDIFNRRGLNVTTLNRNQAMVPENCVVIPNFKGTAPGMIIKQNSNHLLFSLPGVPYEMEALMDNVVSYILQYHKPENIFHRTIATYGIPESTLAEQLDTWENSLPEEIRLAYLPNPSTGIKLRLSIYYGEKQSNTSKVELYVNQLKDLLSEEIIYGEGDTSLEKVVADLIKTNLLSLSIAESCTGGNISSMIVSLPGASSFYKGGIVTYNNSSKEDHLNVNKQILDKYGAVSKECAEMMAEGCMKLFNSDLSLSITGIAGPEGGTNEKPVGTVWIAVCIKGKTTSHTIRFFGDRKRNILRFSSEALNFLRLELLKFLKS